MKEKYLFITVLVLIVIIISGCIGPLENINPKEENNENETIEIVEDENDSSSEQNDIKNYTEQKDRVQYIDSNSSWLVVDKDNPANYRTISEAVKDANDYYKILVNPGTYEESILINKDIELISLGDVRIKPRNNKNYGVKIKNARVTLDGFNISNFDRGLVISNNYENWNIINNKFTKNQVGIYVKNSYGEGNIENAHISKSENYGIDISNTYNKWNIKNSNITNNQNGIRIRDSHYEEDYINNLDLSNNEDTGILSQISTSSRVTNIWYEKSLGSGYILGIRSGKCSDKNCISEVPNENDYIKNRIDKYRTKEPNKYIKVGNNNELKSIKNATEKAKEGNIIVVTKGEYYEHFDINKDLKIVTEGNDQVIIIGYSKTECIDVNQNSKLELAGNFEISTCSAGIDLDETNRNSYIKEVTISNSIQGISASDSSGNWVIKDSRIHNSKTGIYAPGSTGNWLVEKVIIENVNRGAFVDSDENGRIRYSIFGRQIRNYDVSSVDSQTDYSQNYFANGLQTAFKSNIIANNKCSEISCNSRIESPY